MNDLTGAELGSLKEMLMSDDMITIDIARNIIMEFVQAGRTLDAIYNMIVECTTYQTKRYQQDDNYYECANKLGALMVEVGVKRQYDVLDGINDWAEINKKVSDEFKEQDDASSTFRQ